MRSFVDKVLRGYVLLSPSPPCVFLAIPRLLTIGVFQPLSLTY